MKDRRQSVRDRRSFGRIKIIIPAIVSISKPVTDITCDILDISEEGMRISIPEKTYKEFHISPKDIIHFRFIDDYNLGRDSDDNLISGDARVVYVYEVFDHFELGCYIKSELYEQYVRRRRELFDKVE